MLFGDGAAPVDRELKKWLLKAGQRLGRKSRFAGPFSDPPAWLGVTPTEKRHIAELLGRVADEYPATSVDEFIWCVLLGAVRPRRRGRKSKWLGVAGVAFVNEVDRALQARGSSSRDRKALRQVIAEIRSEQPKRYGTYTEERLRDAYYDALPSARFFLGA